MPTEHDPGSCCADPLGNFRPGRQGEPATDDIFQQVCVVVSGATVTSENPVGRIERRWQSTQPRELLGGQRSTRKSVRRILRLGRELGDPSIVVAANRRPTQPDQSFRRLPGPQRSGDTVAEVDDVIRRPPAQVRQDRFERQEIAVDVGQDRDAHPRRISGAAPDASEQPSQSSSTMSTSRCRDHAVARVPRLS